MHTQPNEPSIVPWCPRAAPPKFRDNTSRSRTLFFPHKQCTTPPMVVHAQPGTVFCTHKSHLPCRVSTRSVATNAPNPKMGAHHLNRLPGIPPRTHAPGPRHGVSAVHPQSSSGFSILNPPLPSRHTQPTLGFPILNPPRPFWCGGCELERSMVRPCRTLVPWSSYRWPNAPPSPPSLHCGKGTKAVKGFEDRESRVESRWSWLQNLGCRVWHQERAQCREFGGLRFKG